MCHWKVTTLRFKTLWQFNYGLPAVEGNHVIAAKMTSFPTLLLVEFVFWSEVMGSRPATSSRWGLSCRSEYLTWPVLRKKMASENGEYPWGILDYDICMAVSSWKDIAYHVKVLSHEYVTETKSFVSKQKYVYIFKRGPHIQVIKGCHTYRPFILFVKSSKATFKQRHIPPFLKVSSHAVHLDLTVP